VIDEDSIVEHVTGRINHAVAGIFLCLLSQRSDVDALRFLQALQQSTVPVSHAAVVRYYNHRHDFAIHAAANKQQR